LLTGHWFDSLPQTQQMLDAWVDDYNYRRPIPGHAMLVPPRASGRPAQQPDPV
jgi:transposase InsO family protein